MTAAEFVQVLIRRGLVTTDPAEAGRCCGLPRDEDGFCVHRPGHPVYFAEQTDPAALPPRDEHHHLDLTCGACGEEFGTNCADDDIRCAVCSAHRCPHCGGWFGED